MAPSGDSIAIRVVIIIILLGLSAFFSSSETALTTVNKIRIRTLAEGGNKSAQWVMKLSENQGRMLSHLNRQQCGKSFGLFHAYRAGNGNIWK